MAAGGLAGVRREFRGRSLVVLEAVLMEGGTAGVAQASHTLLTMSAGRVRDWPPLVAPDEEDDDENRNWDSQQPQESVASKTACFVSNVLNGFHTF